MQIKLSVVITVYSETFSLIETVKRLIKNDDNHIYEIILIVSPNSSKECFEVCYSLEKKYNLCKVYIQNNVPGVGYAIREGASYATGTHIGIISADLETEPEAVLRMVEKLRATDCDVVIGNRWLEGGGFKNYDSTKLVLNYIFQKLFMALYWTKISDLTYGFKIIKREVWENIKWEGVLHEIFIETTIKPLALKYKVEQIPTIWIGRVEGESKNTFLRNFRYVRMAISVFISKYYSIN